MGPCRNGQEWLPCSMYYIHWPDIIISAECFISLYIKTHTFHPLVFHNYQTASKPC